MDIDFEFELTRNGDCLQLAGAVNIQGAQALLAQLRPLLEESDPPLRLDLAGVTEIDTAGLQLLLVARRTAAARRRPLAIVAASPVVRSVLELCRWGALPPAAAGGAAS
jgi:anti-sigma B factor antagonist